VAAGRRGERAGSDRHAVAQGPRGEGGGVGATGEAHPDGEPAGRRLDFLMQELNREANTLSSKSQDLETTRSAVDMKVLIEQMREQVQNAE